MITPGILKTETRPHTLASITQTQEPMTFLLFCLALITLIAIDLQARFENNGDEVNMTQQLEASQSWLQLP